MDKKKFVLRLDPRTLSALEKWAADEFRSVNAQVEWILTRTLQERGRMPAEKPAGKDRPESPDKERTREG